MNPDTENLAPIIKRHFYEFKREQLSKPYSPGEKFRRHEIWSAAAEKCVQLQADPYNFVRAAFRYNRVPGGPFPNQLSGAVMTKWYGDLLREVQTAKGQNPIDAEIRLLMSEALQQGLQQNRVRLRDYFISELYVAASVYPAFIRMLLFPQDQQIKDAWGKKATDEILANPQLLEVLRTGGYAIGFMQEFESRT
jgi:hypothetical protein